MHLNPAIVLAIILFAIISSGTLYSVVQPRLGNDELVAGVDDGNQGKSPEQADTSKTQQNKTRADSETKKETNKETDKEVVKTGTELASEGNSQKQVVKQKPAENPRTVVGDGTKKQAKKQQQPEKASAESSKAMVEDKPRVKHPVADKKSESNQSAVKVNTQDTRTGVGQLKAPAGSNYIILLASRSLSNVLAGAKSANEKTSNALRVFETRSGHFVIAAGPHKRKDLANVKNELISLDIAPKDAYYSPGKGFVEQKYP